MPFIVDIDEQALKELQQLKGREAVMFRKFLALIDAFEQNGPHGSHVKKLVGTKNGWRLDFGRYRALFSLQGNKITIWQIGIEKDTQKDYQRWIHILKQGGKIR